jgi:hypothetical protein
MLEADQSYLPENPSTMTRIAATEGLAGAPHRSGRSFLHRVPDCTALRCQLHSITARTMCDAAAQQARSSPREKLAISYPMQNLRGWSFQFLHKTCGGTLERRATVEFGPPGV